LGLPAGPRRRQSLGAEQSKGGGGGEGVHDVRWGQQGWQVRAGGKCGEGRAADWWPGEAGAAAAAAMLALCCWLVACSPVQAGQIADSIQSSFPARVCLQKQSFLTVHACALFSSSDKVIGLVDSM